MYILINIYIQDFSRHGRVNYMLQGRLELLVKVHIYIYISTYMHPYTHMNEFIYMYDVFIYILAPYT